MRPRRPTWEQQYAHRLRFERGVAASYPGMRWSVVGHGRHSRVVYRLRVPIPEYESRKVEFCFRRSTSTPQLERIYADGPTSSPHRYAPWPRDRLKRTSLCVWTPGDPRERSWVPADGLLVLIEITRVHLFKEQYWRETGEWLGEQHLHDASTGEKRC
jgi:hypothetical protein